MTSGFKLTAMEPQHLEGGVRMSRDEGWPHRFEDWAMVAAISKGVVALDGARVVATASATPFGDTVVMNMILVDAAYRRLGLGRRVMEQAMAQLSPPVWYLVATQEGIPLYEKLGFVATGEIVQYQGIVSPIAPTGAAVWAQGDDLDAIRRMDRDATGMERGALFDLLAQETRFAVLRDDDGITGFAGIRAFGRGEVVGPVIARTLEDAQSLVSLILSARQGAFLRIDTGIDSGLAAWVSQYGMAHVGGGIEMRLGAARLSPAASQNVFGLVSQALG